MTTLYSPQKPYKVWSCTRECRKSVVASSLLELKLRGAEKLGYENANISELKVVLEADGTEIEDDSYFQTAEQGTVFLLLREDEKWQAPGIEALKAVPEIVCDALNKMELVEPPSWKIMDDRGNITVVLNWNGGEERTQVDNEMQSEPEQRTPIRSARTTPSPSPILVHSRSTSRSPSPNINAARAALSGLDGGRHSPHRVSFVGPRNGELNREFDSSDSDEDDKNQNELSPTHDHSQCDFHCSALHKDGAQIRVQITKSVATSPIQDTIIVPALSVTDHIGSVPRKAGAKYVRFSDIEASKNANGSDSDETETTEQEEVLSERYLLLVESVNQERHLTIKDIGTILERLGSKIVEVDKLEREKETADCYNWVIKATIRGETLREIGVIYNGHYYGIVEHPGYF